MIPGPIALIRTALSIGLIAFGVLWLCYLGVMVGRREYENEANTRVERLAWGGIAVVSAVVGYPLDIAFNWTYGLALGVTRNLTLSGKLEHIRETQPGGWRRDVADFICQRMLNPYDDGHC